MVVKRVRAAALVLGVCALVITCVSGGGGPVSIQTTSLPNGVVGKPYSSQLQGKNVGGGWFLVSDGFPPGLTLNTSSGLISGTPTLAGTYTFTIEADQNNSFTSPSIDVTLSIIIAAS
jgi:hypothetical protein